MVMLAYTRLPTKTYRKLDRATGGCNLNAHKNIPQPLLRSLLQRSAIAALLALALLPVRSAWADRSVAEQTKFDYLDKILTLRRFYSGDRLKFQSDGTLQGNAPIGAWTIDGQLEVEDVQLHGARLLIKGRRIHRIFDAQHNLQDELSRVGNSHDKQSKDREKALRHLKVEIEIELPSDKPEQKDVSSAMHAVFVTSSESMLDVVPSYWHAYFAKQEGKPAAPVKEPLYTFKPRSGMSPPHAIYQPDPEYSEEARKGKYQGTDVLSLIVDSSGAPTDLQIVKPLGLGLDEKAIEAVSAWKFDPAQKDGKPVSVLINVEVNFRLY
jgi:TonB family protein